jgi:hypothetical protein
VVDTFSRFCPALGQRLSCRGEDVVKTLERACGEGSATCRRPGLIRASSYQPRPGSVGLCAWRDVGLLTTLFVEVKPIDLAGSTKAVQPIALVGVGPGRAGPAQGRVQRVEQREIAGGVDAPG